MILYRARRLADRPRRHPAYEDNSPLTRVRGRWFTSSLASATSHGKTFHRDGEWEIVSVDVPDAIVDGFRVATTPRTACGLSPIDFSLEPQTDYVLPMFRVMDALPVATNDTGRVRDYLFGKPEPTRTQIVAEMARRTGLPVIDVRMSTLTESADALGVPVEQLAALAA